MIIDDFIEWEKTINKEVGIVNSLLTRKLSDEPEELIHDLKVIESYNARIGVFQAYADSFLDRAAQVFLPSRDYGTEMSRKIWLDDRLSPIRMVRDKLEALSDAIKTRITLGQSFLKYQVVLAEQTIREAHV